MDIPINKKWISRKKEDNDDTVNKSNNTIPSEKKSFEKEVASENSNNNIVNKEITRKKKIKQKLLDEKKEEVMSLDDLFESDRTSNEKLKEILQGYDKNLELHSTLEGKKKLIKKKKKKKEVEGSSSEEEIELETPKETTKNSNKDILKIGLALLGGYLLNNFVNSGNSNNTNNFPFNNNNFHY